MVNNKLILQKKITYHIKNIGFHELEIILSKYLLPQIQNLDICELKLLDKLINKDPQILYYYIIKKKGLFFNDLFCK